MIAMDLIKSNTEHRKLECSCGRQFWTSTNMIARCPDCKGVWDGKIRKFVKLRLQHRRGDDYITVLAMPHSSIAECLAQLMADMPLMFYGSSAVQINEISKEEFLALDLDKVAKDSHKYLNELRNSL